MALILVLALAACGDDTDEAADRSAARTSSGGAPAAGSVSLIVAGETYAFDRVRCAFGAEETGRDGRPHDTPALGRRRSALTSASSDK